MFEEFLLFIMLLIFGIAMLLLFPLYSKNPELPKKIIMYAVLTSILSSIISALCLVFLDIDEMDLNSPAFAFYLTVNVCFIFLVTRLYLRKIFKIYKNGILWRFSLFSFLLVLPITAVVVAFFAVLFLGVFGFY